MLKFNLLLIGIYILISPIKLNAQYISSDCCVELLNQVSEEMEWENDSIKFTFKPTEYFWQVRIKNKSNSIIKCLWDEALFIRNDETSNIIFDSTIWLHKNSPKGHDIIVPQSELVKEIFPLELFGETTIFEVFTKEEIEVYGDLKIKLIFPIAHSEKKKDYKFHFIVTLCD